MGSLVGFQGTPTAANYAATKAFIQAFAEGIHYELKPFGVDVLSSAPGPVASGFAKRADMKMGQAATPEEVARGTVEALGRQVTVRPGFLSKFLGWSLIMLPRLTRVRLMHAIMGGMTKHQLVKG
jgi:short-subunit dehydrogenase